MCHNFILSPQEHRQVFCYDQNYSVSTLHSSEMEDEFEAADKDRKSLFVNYGTNVPINFHNLEREIYQNAPRKFKRSEVVWNGIH